MQYTLLILQYAFSVITHKQSDKLATIQRINCHAYDRDGAVCTFSPDLKIYTCLHIYIYIIFGGQRHIIYSPLLIQLCQLIFMQCPWSTPKTQERRDNRNTTLSTQQLKTINKSQRNWINIDFLLYSSQKTRFTLYKFLVNISCERIFSRINFSQRINKI